MIEYSVVVVTGGIIVDPALLKLSTERDAETQAKLLQPYG